MAINYAKIFNRRATPQSQPIPGSSQVRNSGGGYSWAVDDWTRLDRFLILGAEGGTYYITERDLVKQNHDALVRCIKADGIRAVNRIVEISDAGRAPKNDPAIFALALVVTHGDAQAKAHAFANLSKVCRIGTHLFHFAEYVNAMRGWGRGLRSAVGHWYTDRGADDLAHQAIKYQQRDGWSHSDLLRLAHPVAPSRQHDAVFRWMLAGADSLGEREVKRKVRGEDRVAKYGATGALPKLVEGFEQARHATRAGEIVKLIGEFDLPREAIPTQWLNEAVVWEALLERMPMTAMIRNLGKMTSLGLLAPFSDAKRLIMQKLRDETALKRARIHPLAVLVAQKIYAQGHGDKGALKWSPVSAVVDALDEAFYATFQNVEPCNKPVLLALDVSGSIAASRIAGAWSVCEDGFRPKLFIGLESKPEVGERGPPLVLLMARFGEFAPLIRTWLRAQTNAHVVVSPWSEHITAAYDPVLVNAGVKAACAAFGKPVPAAPTAWQWRVIGLLLGIAGALGLMFCLPEVHPRLARVRRFIVPGVLLLALVLTLGTWVGASPQLRRIPAHFVVLSVVWLALVGASRLKMPRWSLAVVTGILAPCCFAVFWATGIFLFGISMAILAISTLLLLPAVAVGRIATRGGSRRDGDVAMAIFASYVIGQFMPLFY